MPLAIIGADYAKDAITLLANQDAGCVRVIALTVRACVSP